MKEISSVHNPQIVSLRELQRPRARRESGLFLAESAKMVAEALSLSWDVSATCTYEGQWSFPANVYCEKNGGESFAGTLGILARARLVVACEVPAYLLDEGGAWTLTLNLGTESFAFELLP